ncbi:hypothetical protein Ciccas_003113 [Cichlidogyrus casuarinus]|uniref:Bridge-like lipid transfer protein family member 1 C-terminal domain-containing protein n=1 Tax=Cichlidogyrus casuarinus TaxID=1844966 RepID=A0ABD2QFZ2_9PLAT
MIPMNRSDSVYLDAKGETPSLLRKRLDSSASPAGQLRESSDSTELQSGTLQRSRPSNLKPEEESFDNEFFDIVDTESSDSYQDFAEDEEMPPKLPPRQNVSTSENLIPPDVEAPASISLKLDISIHVDTGKCVLHPKLQAQASPSHGPGKGTGSMNKFGFFAPQFTPANRSFKPKSASFLFTKNEVFTSGGTLSPEDKLAAYLERFRRFIMDESPHPVSDVTLFYLPAVDVSLRYNSKTKMDVAGSGSVTSGSPSASGTTLYASGVGGQISKVRKQAELYASCSLQKLPKKLIVSPSLLDFLEQALESIPVEEDGMDKLSELEDEVPVEKPSFYAGSDSSVSTPIAEILALDESSENTSSNGDNAEKRSLPSIKSTDNLPNRKSKRCYKGQSRKSSRSGSKGSVAGGGVNTFLLPYSETFPVDVVVHIHVQPSTILFSCMPYSQMQCLMSLSNLSLVFSTKRQTPNSDVVLSSSGVSNPKNDQKIVSHDGIMAETGLCVSAILSGTSVILAFSNTFLEFELLVFHPYSSDFTRRSVGLAGTGISSPMAFGGDAKPNKNGMAGDSSLNLLVRDVKLNMSRSVQTHLVLIQNESILSQLPLSSRNIHMVTHLFVAFKKSDKEDLRPVAL